MWFWIQVLVNAFGQKDIGVYALYRSIAYFSDKCNNELIQLRNLAVTLIFKTKRFTLLGRASSYFF